MKVNIRPIVGSAVLLIMSLASLVGLGIYNDRTTQISLRSTSQPLLEKKYKVAWPESELLGHAVDVAANKYDIPRTLLLAIINQETHFKPRTSKAGAVGYMQVRPQFWHRSKQCPYNVYDTHANVIAGACVLDYYRDKLGSIEDALVAYNVGPSAVHTYEQGVKYRNDVLAQAGK